MPQDSQGSQPATELSPQATPAHVELSQPVNTAATSATATTTATTQAVETTPDVDALKAQLAQEQAQRQQAEQRFRDTQAAYTRSQQAIQALSGNNQGQAQDPNAPYIKALTDQGYNPDDARAMVGVVAQMMAPALAQSQQAAAIAQSTFLVDSTLQTAFQQAPQAFSTPGVQQIVHRQLQEDAARGIQIDPHYASALAKQAWYDVTHAQQSQQPLQMQQQVPAIRSMTGINGNFQGSQAAVSNQPVIRSAEQESLRGFLQSRIATPRN
jgi:hypothetical protein